MENEDYRLRRLGIIKQKFAFITEKAPLFGGWHMVPVHVVNDAREAARELTDLSEELGLQPDIPEDLEEYLNRVEVKVDEISKRFPQEKMEIHKESRLLNIHLRNLAHLEIQKSEAIPSIAEVAERQITDQEESIYSILRR